MANSWDVCLVNSILKALGAKHDLPQFSPARPQKTVPGLRPPSRPDWQLLQWVADPLRTHVYEKENWGGG